MQPRSKSRKTFPSRPLLCYVTDRRGLSGFDEATSPAAILRHIEAAVAAGVDWIQVREKDLPGTGCAALTRAAVQITAGQTRPGSADGRETVSRILVNDRLDVALAENAAGVHLGEKALPVAAVKRFLKTASAGAPGKRSFLIGVSCHSLASAETAAASGADYIFFGPVFSTPSKISLGEPQGLQRLAEVCEKIKIPVLAIGGITLNNAGDCLSRGASGVAAIRLFQDTVPVERVVETLRQLTF